MSMVARWEKWDMYENVRYREDTKGDMRIECVISKEREIAYMNYGGERIEILF